MTRLLSLDFVDLKDDVLMNFLVHGEFASLAECAIAALEVAFKWFLLCVDVHVFFQVLGQGEGFEAQNADVFLDGAVRGHVSAK